LSPEHRAEVLRAAEDPGDYEGRHSEQAGLELGRGVGAWVGGDFEYKDGDSSIEAPGLVRGMFGYINYNASKTVTPPQKVTQSKLKAVLDGLNSPVKETSDSKYVITTPHEKVTVRCRPRSHSSRIARRRQCPSPRGYRNSYTSV
jgi:hypothetical protein